MKFEDFLRNKQSLVLTISFTNRQGNQRFHVRHFHDNATSGGFGETVVNALERFAESQFQLMKSQLENKLREQEAEIAETKRLLNKL